MNERDGGIAVIIPVFNEAATITMLLTALRAMDIAEVIVADAASTDGTLDIVRTFADVTIVASALGRGPQINAAAAVARSPILMIIHADSRPPPDMPRLVRETLSDVSVTAGCFRLAFDRSTPGLDLWAWFSRYETRFTTFGDQGYFMRRTTFEAIGGAPDWPILEDVALRRTLLARGRFVKRGEPIVTSARRFIQRGVVRQQLRNCTILVAYSIGVPVAWLARLYGRPIR